MKRARDQESNKEGIRRFIVTIVVVTTSSLIAKNGRRLNKNVID